MQIKKCLSLAINAPEFFKDPRFVAWLNKRSPKFTWHQGGEPGEWSDVVVLVDPSLNGEGSDSDMPEEIWDKIVEACRQSFTPDMARQYDSHIMVRLINIE